MCLVLLYPVSPTARWNLKRIGRNTGHFESSCKCPDPKDANLHIFFSNGMGPQSQFRVFTGMPDFSGF